MAVNFSVQFRINEKTQSRVLRLTDTSTGFTFGKGNFSVIFSDGSTRIKTDFSTPDISASGGFVDINLVTDSTGAVITGTYKVDYVALDTSLAGYSLSRTFDFNWVKPTKNIVSETDVLVPEVKFLDNTSYSPAGSFTGTVTRTFSTLMPSNTPQSGTNVIGVGNLINPIFAGKYYEGIYTAKSDVSVNYTHTSNSWLTVFYTDLLQEIIDVRRAPTQTQLIGFMNTYHAIITAYEDKNDTQFNLLNEQYDLVVSLYSHLIARYESGTLDGSEPLLGQLLDILRPYSTHTYTAVPLSPFTLDAIGTAGFLLSDGTITDNFFLGETLRFASNSTALTPVITNNSVSFNPTFGVTPNTFASGSDSRFHDAVTLGASTNGLSLSTQQLSLAVATTSVGGAMSAVDKAKLDSIAAGAQTGTVTSIGISMPSAFTVSNSPITTFGTIAITAAGSSAEYIRGDGATGNFNSAARGAISLTTTGTSGAATYSSSTGVLNIPQYQGGVTSFNTRTGAITLTSGDVTTALTFTPYNATNPSNYISRTGISAGTGISYNNTTGVITNTITQYTDALARLAISLTTTGVSGAATYNSTTGVLNIPIYEGGVTSFNTRTGAIILTSGDVTGALGFTPYNATNPAGYTTNVGTVTSVGGTGTVSGLTLTGTVTTSGNLTLGGTLSLTSGNITSGLGFTPEDANNKGVAGGYASLDGSGLVPSTQLPSYVDDVLEYTNLAGFPATGVTGKIYVALDNNKIYRWSGSAYIEVSPTVGTIWGGITGTLANQTDLQSALDAKQDDITLTTTGTSGAATFIGNTLNIPQYEGGVTSFNTRTGAITLTSSDVTTALTFTPYNATNPSAYIALTALSAGTGISYNNTTGVISSTITQYTDALSRAAISLTTTGTSGSATYNSSTGVLNIPSYEGGVTSFNTRTGAITLTSSDITTALTFTPYNATNPSNYIALSALSASAPLSYNNTTGAFTIAQANGTTNGFLSSTDWTTFNNKQNTLTLGNVSEVSSNVLMFPDGGTGKTIGNLTIQVVQSGASTSGYLSSTDWNTFNNKQGAITLTTTGTTGAATLIGNTLNIPEYQGGVSSFNTRTGAITLTSSDVTTALGYTPVTNARTLTINGTTFDLTANRSWTVAGSMPAGGTAGQILSKIDATDYNTIWIDNFASQLKHEVKLGATITKGKAVYVSSADGTNMVVSAASNASESTSSKTLGLLETGGVANDIVKVITEGLLAGLDTSTATAGDPVWLGTGGNLLFGLANKPVAPAHLVFIGIVTRVQSNNGEIFVKVQNGFELNEIHDVLVGSYGTKDVLYRDTTTNLWKNGSIASILGFTPYDAANPSNYIALTALSSTATGLTYTNTTGVFSLTSGYVIPTTTSATNWDTAYTNRITSLTTTGNSGAATLTSNTLNIPEYTLSGLGGQAQLNGTGFVKISGTTISYDNSTYYLASNPSAYIALTALSSTATGLTYTNTTGVFSLTSGYVIPTTSSATNWDTAYTNRITTLTTTGSSGAATLTSNTLNIPTYTLSGLGGVPTSRTITINGTALDLSADRSWTIPAGTALNGTGFVKASGTTISYDNSTYVPTTGTGASGTWGISVSGNSATTSQREFNYLRVNSNNHLYLDYNYGCTTVGVYSANRYQGVFAMGAAYMLPLDGTTPGNLYGLAWSHPNAGGQAGYLSTHGLLVMENGTTNTALANGIWTRGDVTAYSDARVKENVEVITNALDKVQAIRGVTFTRNDRSDTTTRFAGVIAQEVLSVLPEVVTESADGTYSVAYGNMAGLFIEAFKEQQAQIAAQGAQITELLEIVKTLKGV